MKHTSNKKYKHAHAKTSDKVEEVTKNTLNILTLLLCVDISQITILSSLISQQSSK